MKISKALHQRWLNAAPNDSFVFAKLMREEELCVGVLETLLDIDIDHIDYLKVENTIEENFFSKGIQMDVYVKDEVGTVYNVEMQRQKVDDLPKRSRYYGSMMDMNNLGRGADYADLRNSFVIFICNEDPLDRGQCVYAFEYRENNDHDLKLGDGTTKLFFYTRGKDKALLDPRLRKILNFFDDAMPERESDDDLLQRMTDAFYRIKSNHENEVAFMTQAVWINDWKKMGIAEAEAKYKPIFEKQEQELAEKDITIAENKAQLAENKVQLAEQDSKLAEKDNEIEQLKSALKEALAQLPK